MGKNASYALKQMKVAVDEFASKAAVDDNDTETFAMSNGDEPISPTRSSENNHNGESGSKKPRLNPRDSVESDLGANVMERRGSPMNVDSSDHESENNQSIDNANVTGNANQGNDSNPVHDMNECSESLSGAKPDADLLFRKAEYTIDWFDAKMTSLLIGMSSNEVAKLCKNSKNPVEKNEDVNTGCNNGADPDADTCTIANVGSAVDALVFYNKLIVVVQVALVDSFSMRKIAYSNAAAMNLQVRS